MTEFKLCTALLHGTLSKCIGATLLWLWKTSLLHLHQKKNVYTPGWRSGAPLIMLRKWFLKKSNQWSDRMINIMHHIINNIDLWVNILYFNQEINLFGRSIDWRMSRDLRVATTTVKRTDPGGGLQVRRQLGMQVYDLGVDELWGRWARGCPVVQGCTAGMVFNDEISIILCNVFNYLLLGVCPGKRLRTSMASIQEVRYEKWESGDWNVRLQEN